MNNVLLRIWKVHTLCGQWCDDWKKILFFSILVLLVSCIIIYHSDLSIMNIECIIMCSWCYIVWQWPGNNWDMGISKILWYLSVHCYNRSSAQCSFPSQLKPASLWSSWISALVIIVVCSWLLLLSGVYFCEIW